LSGSLVLKRGGRGPEERSENKGELKKSLCKREKVYKYRKRTCGPHIKRSLGRKKKKG